MDIELEQRVKELVDYLNGVSSSPQEFSLMDPVAKMMLVALAHETQKIQDYVDGIDCKIADRFCEDFIPRREVDAMPALSLIDVRPKRRKSNDGVYVVEDGASFVYRMDNKSMMNWMPLFRTLIVPVNDLCVVSPESLKDGNGIHEISVERRNCLWVGIVTDAEIETLKGLSILLHGTDGVIPDHIYAAVEGTELEFADMSCMEQIETVEPFDAQQASGRYFSFVENWKECVLDMDDTALIYITDSLNDRDVFKPKPYPRAFQQWMETELLEAFPGNTVWLCLQFPETYIVPEECSVRLNVMPVVNVDVNSVTLTQSSPIAKLQKQEGSYFLMVLETSNLANRQGFGMNEEEIVIRDFDASCYNAGNLYRDVRNLYNHFIDDYYAFIEYNGIKDGELIRQLRETINRIGKSTGGQNPKYSFDSGTYAMKNMSQYPVSSSVRVTYLTTLGQMGNSPRAGDKLESRKLPFVEDARFICQPSGGRDKAGADERYELLRYYSMTNDRLYTKKDVEAFLRKEIVTEFGKENFRRIFIRMSIEGSPGTARIQRGFYIKVEFKDRKYYELANGSRFADRMYRKILTRSCISIPIFIEIVNLEK